MPSDPLVLSFDTSAAHCAAALLSGGRVLAARGAAMSRGQAEHLVPIIDEVLAEAGATYGMLDRIGVGVGPGNFTGIRISVACARGLAMACDVPAIGVTGFDAIRHGIPGATAAIAAPRDRVYLDDQGEPRQIARADAPQNLRFPPEDPATFAIWIGQVATKAPLGPPPAPLYARPADAAPPKDPAPVILE